MVSVTDHALQRLQWSPGTARGQVISNTNARWSHGVIKLVTSKCHHEYVTRDRITVPLAEPRNLSSCTATWCPDKSAKYYLGWGCSSKWGHSQTQSYFNQCSAQSNPHAANKIFNLKLAAHGSLCAADVAFIGQCCLKKRLFTDVCCRMHFP